MKQLTSHSLDGGACEARLRQDSFFNCHNAGAVHTPGGEELFFAFRRVGVEFVNRHAPFAQQEQRCPAATAAD